MKNMKNNIYILALLANLVGVFGCAMGTEKKEATIVAFLFHGLEQRYSETMKTFVFDDYVYIPYSVYQKLFGNTDSKLCKAVSIQEKTEENQILVSSAMLQGVENEKNDTVFTLPKNPQKNVENQKISVLQIDVMLELLKEEGLDVLAKEKIVNYLKDAKQVLDCELYLPNYQEDQDKDEQGTNIDRQKRLAVSGFYGKCDKKTVKEGCIACRLKEIDKLITPKIEKEIVDGKKTLEEDNKKKEEKIKPLEEKNTFFSKINSFCNNHKTGVRGTEAAFGLALLAALALLAIHYIAKNKDEAIPAWLKPLVTKIKNLDTKIKNNKAVLATIGALVFVAMIGASWGVDYAVTRNQA